MLLSLLKCKQIAPTMARHPFASTLCQRKEPRTPNCFSMGKRLFSQVRQLNNATPHDSHEHEVTRANKFTKPEAPNVAAGLTTVTEGDAGTNIEADYKKMLQNIENPRWKGKATPGRVKQQAPKASNSPIAQKAPKAPKAPKAAARAEKVAVRAAKTAAKTSKVPKAKKEEQETASIEETAIDQELSPRIAWTEYSTDWPLGLPYFALSAPKTNANFENTIVQLNATIKKQKAAIKELQNTANVLTNFKITIAQLKAVIKAQKEELMELRNPGTLLPAMEMSMDAPIDGLVFTDAGPKLSKLYKAPKPDQPSQRPELSMSVAPELPDFARDPMLDKSHQRKKSPARGNRR